LFLGVLRLVWHLLLHPRFFVIVYSGHFPKRHTPLFWRQINTRLGSRVRVFFTGLFRLIFLQSLQNVLRWKLPNNSIAKLHLPLIFQTFWVLSRRMLEHITVGQFLWLTGFLPFIII
jgi:hypothetical protein